jgi:hypothetical protein
MTMGTPESAATTANTKLTEAQALDWLAANPNTGKTIREIAAIWGWSRSTTQRFLSRDDIAGVCSILSRGTSAGQGENFAETGGTSGTSGTASEAAEAPQGQGRVLGRTPSGTIAAAMPDASDLDDDGPPIARAPYSDDFKWEPENGAVIVPQQPAIAVYVNPWGQVVIRAAGEDYGEDAFIRVSPEHVPALIAKLTAIMKEVE